MTAEAVWTSTLLPPRADLSGAKLRLFEAALELFGSRGYHAVSVRDLASAMGQQPGALYFHVASKQQLLYELTAIGHENHRDRLRSALLDTGREPTEQIRAITREHVLVHLEYPNLARITNRETQSLSPEQLVSILAIRAETQRLILDIVERGIRLGSFHADDPFLAVMAIGAMGMRSVEWWTPDMGRTREHVADTYAEFAVKLLA